MEYLFNQLGYDYMVKDKFVVGCYFGPLRQNYLFAQLYAEWLFKVF